jgi:transposase InsO family protein
MKLQATFPTALLCRLLDLPRSSYYYRGHPRDDTALQAQLLAVSGTYPTYGIPRLTAQVRRDYQPVNPKRVRRVARQMGLQPRNKRKKRHTTQSQHAFPRHPNLVLGLPITHPDQVWVCDITYVQLAQEAVYLAILMDVFTRCIRGWHLSRSLDQGLTLTALHGALQTHCPEIHHSDQGLQYAASGYVALLEAHHVQLSMAEVGAAWQNGYAERLIRTIKEEEVNLSEYRDYQHAFERLGRFLDEVYQHKRIHSALGYLTPAEFAAQWRQQPAAVSGVQYK